MKVGFIMARNYYYYYYYSNYENLIKSINLLDNVRGIDYKNFIEFNSEVYIKEIEKTYEKIQLYSKEHFIKFIVFKNINILIILTEKYSDIKSFILENSLLKVNLLNNYLFNRLFKDKFSDNLMKLAISSSNIEAFVDDIEITGNNLLSSEILYNLNDYILDDTTKIRNYSFKPKEYPFAIYIYSTNKMDIKGKCINEKEVMDFIEEFIVYLNDLGAVL